MFKKKKETKTKYSVSKNLDHYHQEEITKIEVLKREIAENTQEIDNLVNVLCNDSDTSNDSDTRDCVDTTVSIKTKINELISKNNGMKNNEMDYYINTNSILNEYYSSGKKAKTQITIDDFFKKVKHVNQDANRSQLLHQYLEVVRPLDCKSIKKKNDMLCLGCHIELIVLDDKTRCCPACGETFDDIFEGETIKNPDGTNSFMGDMQKYSIYQRKHHFRDWLKQIQGKENIDIPVIVLETVKMELNKARFKNLDTLDNNTVRDILKKHNLVKYYENIYHIIYRINGIAPPSLTHEQEEKLMFLFKQVEEPFHMFKAEDRKNILRYSYIIYKLCELLEYDTLLPRFRLLKNRAKLIQQDQIWNKICNHNKWEFILSI